MSHPSSDKPKIQPAVPSSSQPSGTKPVQHQIPAASLKFKRLGGALLTILGILESLGAFAQVLTNILFAPWYMLLLSMLGLALAVTIAGSGLLMLLRRWMPETLSPLLGVASTGALLLLKVVTQLIIGDGFFGLLIPVAFAIAIFIVIGRGMRKMAKPA